MSALVVVEKGNLLFTHSGPVSNLALEDLLEHIRAVDLGKTF